ncbi:glycosyltransferase family 2 protein [Phenylobacterium sp.]|uniref:glycosyltransferase family 2 protein n=1 Tax=Phenylobacterium sp. TaxID=1871053 RepID=UPI00281106D5|nr:glycosyltransferase family 2 protein [Phenylobacterium sp.]
MAQRKDEDKPQVPSVTVAVVAYRSGATLARCLERLAAQTCRDFEVVLVDNASPDREAQAAAGIVPGARLIENAENLGFAAACNQAARAGRGRWLALLNPDAYPQPDWLEQLLAASSRWPGVKSFTSRQVMDEDPEVLDGLGDVMSLPCIPYRGGYLQRDPGDTPEGQVFSPCGAAMLIDRALFLELGGFDESFFCYCEDVDLGYRLQLAGEPTVLVPSAVVRHVGSASSGGSKSEFALFHGYRNRFWVLVKDTPALLLPLVLPAHLLTAAYIATRKPNRPYLGVTLRAYRAALAGLGEVLKRRRTVQRARRRSILGIARAMTWDPRDLSGRRAVIRPLRPTRSAGA